MGGRSMNHIKIKGWDINHKQGFAHVHKHACNYHSFVYFNGHFRSNFSALTRLPKLSSQQCGNQEDNLYIVFIPRIELMLAFWYHRPNPGRPLESNLQFIWTSLFAMSGKPLLSPFSPPMQLVFCYSIFLCRRDAHILPQEEEMYSQDKPYLSSKNFNSKCWGTCQPISKLD